MKISNQAVYMIGIMCLIGAIVTTKFLAGGFLFILGLILSASALIKEDRKINAEKRNREIDSTMELLQIIRVLNSRLDELENKKNTPKIKLSRSFKKKRK